MKTIVFICVLSIAMPMTQSTPAIADTNIISGLDLGPGRVMLPGRRTVTGTNLGLGR